MSPRTKERKIWNHKIDISILLRAHTHTHGQEFSHTARYGSGGRMRVVVVTIGSERNQKFRSPDYILINEIIEVNG
jgi:hypothetical protein